MKTAMIKALTHLGWMVCRLWLGRSTEGAWEFRRNQRVFWPLRLMLKENDSGTVDRVYFFEYRGCDFRLFLKGQSYDVMWKAP